MHLDELVNCYCNISKSSEISNSFSVFTCVLQCGILGLADVPHISVKTRKTLASHMKNGLQNRYTVT
jgi:hypothetical protein